MSESNNPLKQKLDEILDIISNDLSEEEISTLVQFEHKLRLSFSVKAAERLLGRSKDEIPTALTDKENFIGLKRIESSLNFEAPIKQIESEGESYFQLREFYLSLDREITPEKLNSMMENVSILVKQRSKFIREFQTEPDTNTNSLNEKISLIDFTNQLICKILALPHKKIIG